MSFLDPESDFAIRNKKIYTFYVERNLTCQDEESTYVDRAQLVLDHFVNSSYVKACRNNTPEMVRRQSLLFLLLHPSFNTSLPLIPTLKTSLQTLLITDTFSKCYTPPRTLAFLLDSPQKVASF